jgi:hypothetical protein
MTEPPTGTVTMLFTDIEGSTPLVRTLEDDYGAVLEHERRLLRKAVTDSRGYEVDCRADELFAVFQRAEDGVVAAVAAQRLLAAHAWPEGSPVRVRMGLHTGEPGVEGGIYLGRVSARPGTAARSCSHRRRVTWSPTGSTSGTWAATRWQGCLWRSGSSSWRQQGCSRRFRRYGSRAVSADGCPANWPAAAPISRRS